MLWGFGRGMWGGGLRRGGRVFRYNTNCICFNLERDSLFLQELYVKACCMELLRLNNLITEKLSILSTEVSLKGTLNLLDINVMSEQVYSSVLNIVYGWNLSNANLVEHNIMAIDLFDDGQKIIAQVSSDNSKTKVQQSLEKIELHRYSGYNRSEEQHV